MIEITYTEAARLLSIGVPLLLVAIFAVLVCIAVDLNDIKHGKGGGK